MTNETCTNPIGAWLFKELSVEGNPPSNRLTERLNYNSTHSFTHSPGGEMLERVKGLLRLNY